ncbi:hypothetical protein SAMN05519104_0768 [Rhizobiales bacterium GAS188]|nr:hypothetical protein SAMN05519104_0768 [Rhizobiales bacterium GAS188]
MRNRHSVRGATDSLHSFSLAAEVNFRSFILCSKPMPEDAQPGVTHMEAYMLRGLVPVAAAAALIFGASGAKAMPIANADGYADPGIVLVYGGCGPYGHRGPYGGCRAGGQWGGYWRGRPCPPGFHLGPYGRRCWPN